MLYFSFLKKNRQMKTGQNNKYDITKLQVLCRFVSNSKYLVICSFFHLSTSCHHSLFWFSLLAGFRLLALRQFIFNTKYIDWTMILGMEVSIETSMHKVNSQIILKIVVLNISSHSRIILKIVVLNVSSHRELHFYSRHCNF